MDCSVYDVAVVGGGCAGLTAAIGLARAGFTVGVVEAADIGVSGSLGGVFRAEGLSLEEVGALPWERRLIERGVFLTDGRRISGSYYRDADAFRHCFTVLRSRFDSHLAETARREGVEVRTATTVASLIREGRRIIGVATTHGPVYAKLTFLAEGDAGHLVSREGFDRFADSREHPAFLFCLQQILALPAGAVEERFRVGAEEGIAYDFLLRNPGKAHKNARGMLCSNRNGLTLRVVLPLENLGRGLSGEPRSLLDWFADMPALRPWLRDAVRGEWSATLLRSGSLRDVPYLVEDGLAVGGAAAGLGVDFPVENSMEPAVVTGLLLSRAAKSIRAEGGDFDREALVRHYLEPLQQTRAWHDAAFFHRWPVYLRKTRVFFDSGLDLLLDSSSIWGRSRRWLPWKFFAWLGVLARVSWGRWDELRDDLIHLGRTLRLREVTPRPALTRLLLDGALNAFRDLARRPRLHLPPGGTLRLYYHSAGEEGRASAVPGIFRRWFERFRPVLASAAHSLASNEDVPFAEKMKGTIALLIRQINLFDLVAVALFLFPILLVSLALSLVSYRLRHRRSSASVAENRKSDAPSFVPHSAVNSSARPPHIHILRRSTQPSQQAASVHDLPYICPTGVFEIQSAPPETVRVAVHSERCIFCEACWRTYPLVDWGRNVAPRTLPTNEGKNNDNSLESLFGQLERKLHEFDLALIEGSALVDRPHNDYLESLSVFFHQLTIRIHEILLKSADNSKEWRRILDLSADLVVRAGERTRRAWEGRFAWAAADGQLLRQHHLRELRRLLALPCRPAMGTVHSPQPVVRAGGYPAGEDAIAKHLCADIAAQEYLLNAIAQTETTLTETIRAELLAAFLEEVREGLSIRRAEWQRYFDGKTDSTPPRTLPRFEETYRRHGSDFLVDEDAVRKFLNIPENWTTLEQRRVLRSERQEILDSEKRLLALAREWHEALEAEDREVAVGFGRQAAHLLAGKLLLLRTFACLESGDDAELALVLFRVWLDDAATRFDEYTILMRDRLRLPLRRGDRPLVEPDTGSPLRTQAAYLAAADPYASGDFLLAPLDLLQPRLVPEMSGRDVVFAEDLKEISDIKHRFQGLSMSAQRFYLAETLLVEMAGRRAHAPPRPFDLEAACARLLLADLRQTDNALCERCLILQALADEVMPRWLRGDAEARARHLHRDVLELEALKVDFRRDLTAAWQVFGEALGRNADVQASCFALAEAAAWLKAADSTIGRMAWHSRLMQVEEREEPAVQELGRQVLAHAFATIRDRLFRFEEDLAALRRGYYAPHVYAAALLSRRSSDRQDATIFPC